MGKRRRRLANPEKFGVEAQLLLVMAVIAAFPVQFGAEKSVCGLWIGNIRAPVEFFEFTATAFANAFNEIFIRMAHKILERRGLTVFFSHEQHRYKGRKQKQAGCELQRFEVDELGETFALRPIADLIVILNEIDEILRCGSLRKRPLTPSAELRILPGINVAFTERFCEVLNAAKIAVVALSFTGEQRVNGMMEVVIPLSGKAVPS